MASATIPNATAPYAAVERAHMSHIRSDSPTRVSMLLFAAVTSLMIATLGKSASGQPPDPLWYVLPFMLAALAMPWWAIVITACAATAWMQHTADGAKTLGDTSVYLVAYAGSALFISEVSRRRKQEARHISRVSEANELRDEAEGYAKILLESTPLAVITSVESGDIVMANEAARKLLGLDGTRRTNVCEHFPPLVGVIRNGKRVALTRTMVEAMAYRANGESFFAHLWVSSYETRSGIGLVVIVSDASEQLRDREEMGLRQLLTNSRIIAGAVSHEIRNLSAGASVLYQNLGRSELVSGNADFKALGSLIQGLRKLAVADVPSLPDEQLNGVDVSALLQELRIVISPTFRESETELCWELAENLPRVQGEHTGLLQVFLNLAQNCHRAVQDLPPKIVTISAYKVGASVTVRFCDSGFGIPVPDNLFQPFQYSSEGTGLGLYVSRAIIRTFGGELTYQRINSLSCFVVELPAVTYFEAIHA